MCTDAAHVHSPAGGQGLNSGIMDSVRSFPYIGHVLSLTSDIIDEPRMETGSRHQRARACLIT